MEEKPPLGPGEFGNHSAAQHRRGAEGRHRLRIRSQLLVSDDEIDVSAFVRAYAQIISELAQESRQEAI